MLKTSLLDAADCMNLRDFFQYYRHRYFGLKHPDGTVAPAYVDPQTLQGGEQIICTSLSSNLNDKTQELYPWNVLRATGLFGSPKLGNTPLGPTYVYLFAYPRRESSKGLNLANVETMMPNDQFVLNKYNNKIKTLSRSMGKYSFGCPEEMATVYKIYNKEFYEWEQAVRDLERGLTLGCTLNSMCGLYLDEGVPNIMFSFKDIKDLARLIPTGGTYRLDVQRSYKHLIPAIAESVPQHIEIR